MAHAIHKYYLRNNKTFKYECERDNFKELRTLEDKKRYLNEVDDVMMAGGVEAEVDAIQTPTLENGLFVT